MDLAPQENFKDRFENLFRVALKITSSLNIGQILELIRDEAKTTIPHAEEVCLLMFDLEASQYTRPLHCSVFKERISCQLCKRGRESIQSSLACPWLALPAPPDPSTSLPLREVAIPICQDGQPLAVLSATARAGDSFSKLELVLLKDLLDLAGNVIINSRNHWKMEQEKWTVDRILGHLRPFVPETVQRIVEKNPDAPHLEKRDLDVSVLFLDVAGYTRISQMLTREKVSFIIEKYFSSFLDVIYAHGGDINETAGDGLMVIFQGAERENALNAARASLSIRNRTQELNQELEGRFMPLQVNMGINSGTTSLGMTQFHGTTGTRMTFTATGPVTNLASRIASTAKEGDILVGPDTAHRIETEIPLHDRGIMEFKNVLEGVRVYSLVHPGQSADLGASRPGQQGRA